jgi:hypothetical protein
VNPRELADELGISPKTLRSWLRSGWPREEPGAAWALTAGQVEAARQRWAKRVAPESPARVPESPSRPSQQGRDESYVLDLLDELLGVRGSRQHRFDWLVGDPGQDTQRRQLPVDSYWPGLGLVVEYRERQHDEPISHFDKPDRMTVSGVHRGEQRRLYDERRDTLVPNHGLTLLIVKPAQLAADTRGRLRRHPEVDRRALLALLRSADIL